MEDRNNNNQRMDIQTEVTRVEPDRLLEVRLNVPAGFTGTVDLRTAADGARRGRT